MLIDTHCHLDDSKYEQDLDLVIALAKENGVEKFIIPGADPKTLKRASFLASRYENIYFSVGVHPYDIDNFSKEELLKYIENKKCIAIGECGLDYYRLPTDKDEALKVKERQKEVFIEHILLANSFNLPLIVHIRDASIDALEILKEYKVKRGGVLHCYNAHPDLLELSQDFYFGIGGVLTFKNAKKLVEIYPKIPKERLLIETDAPYLTPHPHRGKRNEPKYSKIIAQKMSELSNISLEEIENITTQNAKKLFGDI